jgi:hypothetical protein
MEKVGRLIGKWLIAGGFPEGCKSETENAAKLALGHANSDLVITSF